MGYAGAGGLDSTIFRIAPIRSALAIRATSDAQGQVEFTLPFAGNWMLNAVHMVPVTGSPDVDWDSFRGSLSFTL